MVPSPLVYQNVLYYVKNGGILAALDANAGKTLKQSRVQGALDPFSASPWLPRARSILRVKVAKLS